MVEVPSGEVRKLLVAPSPQTVGDPKHSPGSPLLTVQHCSVEVRNIFLCAGGLLKYSDLKET